MKIYTGRIFADESERLKIQESVSKGEKEHMKVSIDRDGCISCGLCAETCPAVFRMAADGLAEVYAAPSAETAALVREAADGCPVSVIQTEE